MRVIESHDGTLKDLATRPVTIDVRLAISVHGNSSASVAAKKSYTIELRDESGADRDLPVLGMPSDSDFILYHCFLDPTYVRNALAYAVGRELGRWAPRTRYVELMLDGKYQGLYMLVEKIKRENLPGACPQESIGASTRTG